MKKLHFIIALFFLGVWGACKPGSHKTDFDISLLLDYYETNNISISENKRVATIKVYHSLLVKRELQRTEGRNWSTSESYASMGALIYADHLKKKESIDSIVVKINGEQYRYSMKQLLPIKKFVSVCKVFCQAVSNKNYTRAKEMMSNEIVGKMDTIQLNDFLSTLFSQKNVEKIVLIGHILDANDILGLYVNVYFEGVKAQTYIFNFRLKGEDKIVGIQIP